MKNNVCKKREWGQTIGKSNPLSGYKKIRTSQEVIKILVTNIILYHKNYLILTNFKKSNLKNIFKHMFFKLGDVVSGVYSAFFNVTVVPVSSMLTSQLTVSPGLISKNFLTCWGIINLAESNLLLPFPTFDLYLNIGIISFLCFHVNISVRSSINIYV